MPSPRYSILLPTRNAFRYLPFAIDSVLSQDFNDFELIVSNNHSTDGTSEYLESLDDPRLVKIRPDAEIPMSAHFEFLIAHAKGDWIALIGDDDALMPFFFERLEALDLNTIRQDAIVFRRAYYFWPGCEELYGDRVVAYYPALGHVVVNSTFAIIMCVCSIIDYMFIPQIYTTGLVKRAFVDRIKARSEGKLIHSLAPDAASAALMALNSKSYFRIEEPLFWTGTSPKSVGFSQGSKQKDRSLEFDKQNEVLEKSSPPQIPSRLLSVFDLATIFYDALLKCPGAPSFWRSRIVRNLFLAGLIVQKGRARDEVEDYYAGQIRPFEIFPFIAVVWIFKNLYRFGAHVRNRYFIKHMDFLLSGDRKAFPNIKEASNHVDAIYKKNIKHKFR